VRPRLGAFHDLRLAHSVSVDIALSRLGCLSSLGCVATKRQRLDAAALTAVLPVVALLPAWFVSTSLIWFVAAVTFDPPYVVFMGVVASGSVVMFLPFTQRIFLTRMLGVRPPDADELRRLTSAIRIVVAAAGTPRRRFIIAIDESDDVNAFACGGHVLVVSSFAVRNLDDDELTGVVAHEFSHHVGAHTIGLSFAQWFSLPVLLCARIGEFAVVTARRPLRRLADLGRFGPHAARLIGWLLAAFAWAFSSTLTVARNVNDFVGRDAEFHADRRVVEMGFGRQLARALARVAPRDGSAIGRSRLDRVYSSHPPARTRIARIDALLRRRRL